MKNLSTIFASIKKALPKAVGYAIEAFAVGGAIMSINDYLHARNLVKDLEAVEKIEIEQSSEDVTE